MWWGIQGWSGQLRGELIEQSYFLCGELVHTAGRPNCMNHRSCNLDVLRGTPYKRVPEESHGFQYCSIALALCELDQDFPQSTRVAASAIVSRVSPRKIRLMCAHHDCLISRVQSIFVSKKSDEANSLKTDGEPGRTRR